jgi:hypothetical protein
MEKNKNYLIQFMSIFCLGYGILSKLKYDLTIHLSLIAVGYLLLSFVIEDKTTKKIHIVSSSILILMIWILGSFNYFKI